VIEISTSKNLTFAASRAVCCFVCAVATFFVAVALQAQTVSPVAADEKAPYIIEGVNDNDVFGIGRSIIVARND